MKPYLPFQVWGRDKHGCPRYVAAFATPAEATRFIARLQKSAAVEDRLRDFWIKKL